MFMSTSSFPCQKFYDKYWKFKYDESSRFFWRLEPCVCVVSIQGLQVHSLNIGWSYLLPLSPPLLAAQVDQVAANHDADLGHKISSEPKPNFLQTLL